MKYGFSLIVRGEDATPDTFVGIAERSEALDMDSLWLSAHVVLPPQVKSGYVLIPGRPHPPHWRECYWEPFTVLSFLAAHTKRITLGTSVVVLPMHNPFECAKQVAEVDRLSGGRFVFGVGVGADEGYSLAAAQFVERSVVGEVQEPVAEDAARLVEAPGARPEGGERLLRQVFGERVVFEDAVGHAEHRPAVAVVQLFEGTGGAARDLAGEFRVRRSRQGGGLALHRLQPHNAPFTSVIRRGRGFGFIGG